MCSSTQRPCVRQHPAHLSREVSPAQLHVTGPAVGSTVPRESSPPASLLPTFPPSPRDPDGGPHAAVTMSRHVGTHRAPGTV